MTFSIWSAETGGTSLWSEGPTSITTKDGLFSAVLGGTSALSIDFNSAQYWIQMQVDTVIYTPRQRVTATAMALNAALFDGKPSSDFATAAHTHATLTRGTGLTGSDYNGSAVSTFSVAYGSVASTAVQGNTQITITAGAGMSGGGTITLGAGGTVTLTNADAGSSQNIFKNIADTTPTTQFSASTNNDTIQFAAGGRTAVSFTPASKRVTYTTTLATLTRGTGLTGAGGNYDGSAVSTFAVSYGSTAGTAVQGNTSITIAAGTGMGGGGSITLGAGGTVTLTNADGGSSQNIFKNIANSAGTTQFSAATNSDTIRFAGTNRSTVSFTPATKLVTVDTTLSTLTRGTGLTGAGGDYDGSAASTFAVSYGSTAGTAVQGSTQVVINTGTGLTGGATVTLGAGGTINLGIDTAGYFDPRYVNAAGDTMTGTLQGRQLNPTANVTYNLGTSALRYNYGYMRYLNASGNSTIGGTLGVTDAITGSSTVQGTRLISTIATGTAPLTVASTTHVPNLNADLLDGYHASTTRDAANTIPIRDANGYMQLGWINTTSGDNGTTAPARIYASQDAYIRYYTPANFAAVMRPHMGCNVKSFTVGATTNCDVGYMVVATMKDNVTYGGEIFNRVLFNPESMAGGTPVTGRIICCPAVTPFP